MENSSHQLLETPMDVVQDRPILDAESLKDDEETEANSITEEVPVVETEEPHVDPMDTFEVPVIDSVERHLADSTIHPTSPILADTASETDRPCSSRAESVDGEKLEEDGDSRAEGVIAYTVPDVRKLADVGITSQPVYVRNLPWRIMVMKRKARTSASHLHEDGWSLGYFLQCNMDADSVSWTCHAQAELRLLPWKTETPVMKRQITHMFYNKENDWGFTNFLSIEDLLDPVKGYINPNDYSLNLQVQLQADPPHGVCWDSKKYTGYIGLKNQGATCYMNSLLQALYFTNKLRKAVYLIPTEADDPVRSVPLAVQRVSYELQTSNKPVGTKKLTKSFGWETLDSFMQHDAQELCRVLLDNIDMKMKGTRVEGTIPNLFEGKMISYIRCKHVDYESSREESFMDIQLNVKDKKDVYDSFDDYVAIEVLDGDNKYDAGDHGLQEAEKGIYFESFPPVLHLQLKRFQFDPVSENNIKINDRFEFPEHLDLRKYLKVPAAIEPVYFLHAVLVHSGDNHGGHYVVYINPKGDGKWCKFDDDVVVKCLKKEAIERNYGGSSEDFMQFRNCTNAYMLVYINEKMKGEILQPVTESDVPGYLSHRLADERDVEMRRRKEKSEQSALLNLRVVTEDDLAVHQGHELVDFDKVMSRKPYRIRKDTNLVQFNQLLAEWFGYKQEEIRYWSWQSRQNGSARPGLLQVESLRLEEHTVQELSSEEEDLVAFVEVLPYRNPRSGLNESKMINQRQEDDIYLFFRLYDPVRRVLEYKGYDIFPAKLQSKELMEACNRKAGFPPGTMLFMFNDVKVNSVERLASPDLPYGRFQSGLELNEGDLIVFQKALSPDEEERLVLPTVKDFFKDLTFRTDVEFVDKEKPNDENSNFSLTLNLKMSYTQVVHAVAARLKTDPKRIQLFRCQSSLRDTPGTAVQFASESTLRDLVISRTNMSKPKKLFYHQLDMDIDELEARKEVKVVWQPNSRDEGREFSILVNKRGTVKDVLDQARKLIELNPGGSGQLRFVELSGTRITNTISTSVPLDNITSISGNRIFRIEEIPLDQVKLESDEFLIAAAHFHKDTHPTFGIPFYLRVKVGEVFKEVKERIRILLGVDVTDFAKYKFCLCHLGKQIYLEDEQKVTLRELNPHGTYMGFAAGVIGTTTWLGIDHLNRAPKRPRPAYQEKAVRIYN